MMKPTRLIVTNTHSTAYNPDLLVFCALQAEKGCPVCDDRVKEQVDRAFKLGDFSGKSDDQLLFYPSENSKKDPSAKRILVIGIGRKKETDQPDKRYDIIRTAGGHIASVSKRIKAKKIMICLPEMEMLSLEETGHCLTEGIFLGDYQFKKYQKSKEDEAPYAGLKEVKLYTAASVRKVRKAAGLGFNAAQAACEARDMANEPGNGWTPAQFAQYAQKLSKKYSLHYTCLEKKDMKKLGMGGILAVNQGSSIPPKMVILEYRPAKASETILLVGKGITFDSGGVSLKPSAGMEEMKYDMCGGAAVLSAMAVVGKEKPGVGVTAIIPSTDNMSGSSAVKPGDIIRHYNGVTSEIVNTDAEGRMILADALAYGIEMYKPDCVVDIATLTGAVIIGLGHHYSGILSNNDELVRRLEQAGEKSGEPLWRLPMDSAYSKQIESKVADIKNVGGKPAGTITAAAYLKNFVGETPWAHLDIAGTAWDFTEKSYIPKGPSGIGVRTFIQLIRQWKNGGFK